MLTWVHSCLLPRGPPVSIMGSSPSESQLSPGWLGIESRGVGASTLLPCCTAFHFQPTLPPPPLQNLTVTPCSLKCQPHNR